MKYDCIIIGGGIAGLQASIQLGRYNRSVLVIDSDDGRSNRCLKYNNILGFPGGVSGPTLRNNGRLQAKESGVEFLFGEVTGLKRNKAFFSLKTACGLEYAAATVLLATGVKDHIPDIDGIQQCLGSSIYVCPDCDGYEITGKTTLIIGAGDAGASMTSTLLYWSDDLTYFNHGGGEISHVLFQHLEEEAVKVKNGTIKRIITNDGIFKGVEAADGSTIYAEKGFIAFGGNKVKTDLAVQAGAKLRKNKHIIVDPQTKMTSVKNLWAAGDASAHSELVTAAMGEGSIAAIWIQKELKKQR
ncbi:NAD(P)/FAD-dependent oxidoreductase [Halobacillus campisalis]|uniref:NAD(P)/FAD-dependent oxidoreductase n=1 Tax=Halobacillus campisalis TaxID=435909 RepID=A0ABW2K9M8_9BACI|nr:NAD(P)/FAD-dependent oxidoreductase [Halobacillus campisalis]